MSDVVQQRQPTEEEKAMWSAEAERALADASLAAAEAERERVNVALLNMQKEVVEIERDRELYKRSVELAQNEHNRLFNFSAAVGEGSVAGCIKTLQSWVRMDKAKGVPPGEIEIAFFSPGGSVLDGMALFDYIQFVRSQGYYITTSTIGYAASMAGILLQAGDRRIAGRESSILIHEVSFGAQGSFGKVEDQVEWVKGLQDRVIEIFASRAQPINPRSTKGFFKKNWSRKDWWLSAPEALRVGVVDEIRESRPFPVATGDGTAAPNGDAPAQAA